MQTADPTTDQELARFAAGKVDPHRFGHAEHLRLAYELLARHSFTSAADAFAAGLSKVAAKLGKPDLYNATITVAFFALIAERRAALNTPDWKQFIHLNPDLLDKSCLNRWYDPADLTSTVARDAFVLPKPARKVTLTPQKPARPTALPVELRARLLKPLTAYVVTYSAAIAWASAATVAHGYPNNFVPVVLGMIELVGAMLFLFPKTRTVAAGVLVSVFTFAIVAETLSGGSPTRFIIYAASVLFVTVLSRLCGPSLNQTD